MEVDAVPWVRDSKLLPEPERYELADKLLKAIADPERLRAVFGAAVADSFAQATKTILMPERQTDMIRLSVEFCAHEAVREMRT